MSSLKFVSVFVIMCLKGNSYLFIFIFIRSCLKFVSLCLCDYVNLCLKGKLLFLFIFLFFKDCMARD